LGSLSKNAKGLDTGKYKDIAMQAVEKVKADHELPQDQLKKLTAYLEKDIKKLVGADAKKATKSATKTAKKVVKAVKKTVKKVS
jgi:16S rRNA G1207 methylase RsmC